MNKQIGDGVQKKKLANQVVTAVDLGLNISEKEKSYVSSVAFSTWVRSLLQNWRQGTVSCKGRSDVSSTGKKPWKQKGTGRARAGSFRSPLWKGGGVTFGPQKRSRVLVVTKKTKRRVLGGLLLEYLRDKRISCIDWLPSMDKPKTSSIANMIKDAGLSGKKVLFFLPADDFLVHASCANISSVNVLFFDQANAFDLANSMHWLYLKRDADNFKDMVSRWI